MKGKKTIWLLAAGFVVLLVGASVLYSRLSGSVEMGGLVTGQAPAQESAGEESSAGSAEEESAGEGNPAGTSAAGEESTGAESAAGESGETELPPAPDFVVYDADGAQVGLSDFLGKPVVLNFWASWCGPCQMEMPDFDQVWAELGEEVVFMMVNATSGRETLESAKAFVEEKGYAFPVYYDTDMSASMAYGVNSLPTTYFIDAQGRAVAYGMGAMSRDTLLQGIEMIRPATP